LVRRTSSAAAAAFALGLLAAGATGCQRQAEEPPPSGARSGRSVKVPMAEGWSPRLGAEQSLTVGPPGRAVLRIDLRPGQAASKPDAEALAKLFVSGLDAGASSIAVKKKDQDGFSWVTFKLSLGPGGPRGAGAPGEPALLGAKVLGDDLFLCATLPGASESEVESAVKACEGISYSTEP
jgi:hypothetical protein